MALIRNSPLLPWAMAAIEALVAARVWRADLRRRRLAVPWAASFVVLVAVGVAGAYALGRLVTGQLDRADSSWFGGLIVGAVALVVMARLRRASTLQTVEAAAPAAALGYGVGSLGRLGTSSQENLPEFATLIGAVIAWYLWQEGKREIQWQRPEGIVLSEYLILTGGWLLAHELLTPSGAMHLLNLAFSALSIAAGLAVLSIILPRYFRVSEEHRVIQTVTSSGEAIQSEWAKPTPECPNPDQWRMYDPMAAEVEVLQFLKCLVTTVKPNLIVETGTFMGVSTVWMAEGLKENGFGHIITCEFDPVVFAKAKERIEASGLERWVEYRNQSSLEMQIDGTIDLFFSDSDMPIREQEVRRFLPQINPHGLILMHDASSDLKIVREAANRLRDEGLISAVFIPTPRGLVVAQKRAGHS